MSPSEVFYRIQKCWKKQWSICFLSVLAFGLAVHMYKLTNTLQNWDSIQNVYSDQNTIQLGRCFLTFACGISSYYDLPWLNGILSLIYLGCSAVLVSELLEITHTPSLVLLGGLIASFPAVTSTFAYMYTADGYFLGMLCMTLAVFLSLRTKRGWIAGIFLLGFGYGCYQAYVTWAILLVLIWTISVLLFTETGIGAIIPRLVHAALCGLLGTAFYGICNKVMLLLQQTSLTSYQGIGEIASPKSFELIKAAKQCLVDFAYFFIGPLKQMNFYSFLNIIVLIMTAVLTLRTILHQKKYRDRKRFFLLCFCYAAIPFSAYAIYFVSPGTNYHMLMMMSMCLIYIYFLLFLEKTYEEKTQFAIQWCVLGLTALVVYQFAVTANISYHIMQKSYNRSYALVQQMSVEIARTRGASGCEKMTVYGSLPGSDRISVNLPPDMTGIVDGYIMSTPVHYQAMLAQDWGLEYQPADEADRELLVRTSEFQNMPVWPEQGSIAVINDILVIKLENESGTGE